jgi:hypothetical protein
LSHTYRASQVSDAESREEFHRLQRNLNDPQPEFTFLVRYAVPVKLFAGQTCYFDGTTYSPGAGEGLYARDKANSVWRFLGPGYSTGYGGTVTQATNKSTGVTLDKHSGDITMNAAALAADTAASFTLTNSAIAATDLLLPNHVSGGTAGAYTINTACASGSAVITVRNVTAGSLSEAIVIRFAVIKGATS